MGRLGLVWVLLPRERRLRSGHDAGIPLAKTHPSKADAADELAAKHGLPVISDLLRDLNDARKAAAYGDVERPDLDPEDVAAVIEKYVQAVERFLED